MRISDWSSNVCSSDLGITSTRQVRKPPVSFATRENLLRCVSSVEQPLHRVRLHSSTLVLREIADGAFSKLRFPAAHASLGVHAPGRCRHSWRWCNQRLSRPAQNNGRSNTSPTHLTRNRNIQR